MRYVAFLRGIGPANPAMRNENLRRVAEELGHRNVQTVIASGNLLFESDASEAEVRAILEASLAAYAGKPVGVVVRTAEEMAAVLAANPFPERAPNRTVAIFLDEPPPADTLARVVAPDGEEVRLGAREIYVHYGESMARSKLRIPGAGAGTARNFNTITRLVALAGE